MIVPSQRVRPDRRQKEVLVRGLYSPLEGVFQHTGGDSTFTAGAKSMLQQAVADLPIFWSKAGSAQHINLQLRDVLHNKSLKLVVIEAAKRNEDPK